MARRRKQSVALTSMIGASESNLQKLGERLGNKRNMGISEYGRKRKALHQLV